VSPLYAWRRRTRLSRRRHLDCANLNDQQDLNARPEDKMRNIEAAIPIRIYNSSILSSAQMGKLTGRVAELAVTWNGTLVYMPGGQA
jgi:hypothetical protein